MFLDIVGYSKLLITEQCELLRKLTSLVLETEQFRTTDGEGKLVRIGPGDGMALSGSSFIQVSLIIKLTA